MGKRAPTSGKRPRDRFVAVRRMLRDHADPVKAPQSLQRCATMCYMGNNDRVGIRELRQNLSKYLRRIAAGESLRVTDRGRPVAALVPLPEHTGSLDRLAAEGRIIPARLRLGELGPPPDISAELPISEALQEQRSEP